MTCSTCRREIAQYSNYCYFCGARQTDSVVRPDGPKRLTRSSTDKKIAGVCGGIAEYFHADPGVLRILVALLTIATGCIFGIIAYIVAWVVLPLGRADVTAVSQAASVPPAP